MRRKNESLNLKQSAKLDDVVRYIRDLGTRFSVAGPGALAGSFKPPDIESLQNQMSQLSMAKSDVAYDPEKSEVRKLSD